MNCDNCPHLVKIRKALAPCQVCEAGELHGQIRITRETEDWAMSMRKLSDHTQSAGVTNLSPDDEDVLRKALSALFQLEPIELLMVQHIMHGESYASFAKPLYKLLKRLRPKEAELEGRKQGFRQLAKVWADAIAVKMPQIAPVMKARINGDM